jgi:hypothetical protein
MPIVKNKTTEKNREFWSHVEEVTQQVNTWPDWMKNEPIASTGEERDCSAQQRASREPKASAA